MKQTKKEKVIELFKEGKTPIQIANSLSMHSNNVYTILSKYRLEKELEVLKNK